VPDPRVLLRWLQDRTDQATAAMFDAATRQSTPEPGSRAGDDGHKRRHGSKVHLAVDSLGHLRALLITPANKQE
jgi:hypothetical protein